jgi:ribose/xylose/arabinose/galactoside ABC-type transport system permease subunit
MKDKIVEFLKKYTIVLVLIGLIILFGIIKPVFFSWHNIINILTQQSYVIIAAIGLSFIMISGGMDLSIGYQMSLVGVITTMCIMWYSIPIYFSIMIGLAMGIILGLFNGIAAVKLKVHPLIITL